MVNTKFLTEEACECIINGVSQMAQDYESANHDGVLKGAVPMGDGYLCEAIVIFDDKFTKILSAILHPYKEASTLYHYSSLENVAGNKAVDISLVEKALRKSLNYMDDQYISRANECIATKDIAFNVRSGGDEKGVMVAWRIDTGTLYRIVIDNRKLKASV